jgi:hypothetical protein
MCNSLFGAMLPVSSNLTSAPNPKFAHIVLQDRLRTSGSKGALEP